MALTELQRAVCRFMAQNRIASRESYVAGAALSREWRLILEDARQIVAQLPAEHAGTCVLTGAGALCRGDSAELPAVIGAGGLLFHPGRIRGALPRIVQE